MQASSIESAELTEQLLDIIAKEGIIDRAKLTLDAELDSFSIVSADFVMILMAIEEKFDVYISVDDELTNAKTLGDLVSMFLTKITEDNAGSPAN